MGQVYDKVMWVVMSVYLIYSRTEITEIEMVVNKERERYQATTQNKHDGVSAIPHVAINDMVSNFLNIN